MDYSQLQGQNLTRGWFQHYYNPIDDEGISLAERQWDEQQKEADKKVDELMEKAIEEMPLIGYNVPEFPGDETFVAIRMKREAEEARGKKVAVAVPKLTAKAATITKGPSTVSEKKAANALSIKPESTKVATIRPKPAPKARIPTSFLTRSKGTTTPKPTNPYPMRHTAATVTSKTTLGYTNGRAASVTLSQNAGNKAARTARPPPTGSSSSTTTLTSAMLSTVRAQPELGTEEWRRMKAFSDFESDDEVAQSLKGGGWDLVDEEAEQEFVLGW
jgi:hypothetical protein